MIGRLKTRSPQGAEITLPMAPQSGDPPSILILLPWDVSSWVCDNYAIGPTGPGDRMRLFPEDVTEVLL